MNHFGPNQTIIYHMSTITMVLNCYIDSFQKFYECTFFWDTMWNHNFRCFSLHAGTDRGLSPNPSGVSLSALEPLFLICP